MGYQPRTWGPLPRRLSLQSFDVDFDSHSESSWGKNKEESGSAQLRRDDLHRRLWRASGASWIME